MKKRKDLASQLLLVSLVSSSDAPIVTDTKLFLKTRGGKWMKLKWPTPGRSGLSFDDVWGACCKKKRKDGGRVDVVSVSEFLREAGCNGKRVLERVDTRTGEGSKLGLVKNSNFWQQRGTADAALGSSGLRQRRRSVRCGRSCASDCVSAGARSAPCRSMLVRSWHLVRAHRRREALVTNV